MRLEEINIGKTEESKRKAMERITTQAILRDKQWGWLHVSIIKEKNDTQKYGIKRGDSGGKMTLWYNNLQELIILHSSRGYLLPEELLPPKP
jgi:hypothetical protein